MAFEQIFKGKDPEEKDEVEVLDAVGEKENTEELILSLDERMMKGSPIYRRLTPKERSEYLKEFIDLHFKKEEQ